jgi:hypothetical protein
MRRLKTILGMTAAALMIASSGAHSLFGWKELRGELERAKAPADLILALSLGWQFAGTAMLVFGCIVMELYFLRLRGKAVSLWPAVFIGVAYLAFGAVALLMSHFDPFFAVFVVPGVLLLIASALRD